MRLPGFRHILPGFILQAILLASLHAAPVQGSTSDELQVLQNADSGSKKTLVLNPKSLDSIYHFAVGVSYTGAQMRYQFTPKWATEYRYQTGKASSDYGDVKSNAAEIYDSVSGGRMPVDGEGNPQPWPKDQVATFKEWMDEGCRP